MKKILALFLLLNFAVLSACQSVQRVDEPTDESKETIIKEAPFHQGDSVHVALPEPAKCIVTGCGNTLCLDHIAEEKNCRFDPEEACYKKDVCKMKKYRYSNALHCGWEETPEFKQCEKEVEQEIADVNKRFRENRGKCKPNESCTFEYLFREDHFQFDLPPYRRAFFNGHAISIGIIDDNDEDLALYMTIYIYMGKNGIFDKGKPSYKKEEVSVNGVPAVKYDLEYKSAGDVWDCTGYGLIYKDKIYDFYGHEFCADESAREIISTFRFL